MISTTEPTTVSVKFNIGETETTADLKLTATDSYVVDLQEFDGETITEPCHFHYQNSDWLKLPVRQHFSPLFASLFLGFLVCLLTVRAWW